MLNRYPFAVSTPYSLPSSMVSIAEWKAEPAAIAGVASRLESLSRIHFKSRASSFSHISYNARLLTLALIMQIDSLSQASPLVPPANLQFDREPSFCRRSD